MFSKPGNIIFLVLLIFFFSTCIDQTRSAGVWSGGKYIAPLRDLETIKKSGRLRVVVEYNSTNYFVYKGKPMGFKFELLKDLTRHLGVQLELFVSNDLEETFLGLESGRYDLAARSIVVTRERNERIDFTRPIEQTRQMLVQRKPDALPDKLPVPLVRNQLELAGKTIHVQKNSSFLHRLRSLENEIGEALLIVQDSVSSVETLVEKVAKGEIEYTVCAENMTPIYQLYYPLLDMATPLSFPQNIAWGMRKGTVHLKEYVDSWLDELQGSYHYVVLQEKYHKNALAKSRRINEYHSINSGRISRFDGLIRTEALVGDWDWRLIAALIYKESQFDPEAGSWTGAGGLMQLMPETAAMYGVDDISDPQQNIRAGISLLNWLNNQFANDIPDPNERLKFVLASYNVGLGHVKDAQRLAARYNKEPNRWENNVDFFLLNKSQPQYFTDPVVRWGYCRGKEPFDFVNEVLAYYKHYRNVIPN